MGCVFLWVISKAFMSPKGGNPEYRKKSSGLGDVVMMCMFQKLEH